MFLGDWLSNLLSGFSNRRGTSTKTHRRRQHAALNGNSHSEQLETRVLPAAVITVVNVDSLPAATDADSDGVADPGDQIHYTVTVQNTGDAPATNLTFQEIINDPNLTLVPGSINVSPLAVNDTFTAVANTQLVVGNATPAFGPYASVAGNVLANDTEFLGDTFTISAFDVTSAQGGSINLETTGPNAGSFVYIPQAGDTGVDTFTYTLRDDGIDGIAGNADDLISIGTVTITIGTQQVWYVNNAAGANGDGTSNNPFDSLADVTGASGPDGSGDIIYLSTGGGTYGGGMTLLASETLWGQGEALIVDGFTLQAAGTRPTLSHNASSTISLSSNNGIRGLNVTNSNGSGISGSAVGTLALSNFDVTVTGGTALSVSTSGTITATGTDNDLSSSNGTALSVTSVNIGAAGLTFKSITSGSASNSTATGIILDTTGNSGGLTVTGSGTAGSGGTIRNKTGTDGSVATGVGIYLNSTSFVSLAHMQLNDFQNFAIVGSSVNGFVLDQSVVSGLSGTTASGVDTSSEAAIAFNNLSGVAGITDSDITGGRNENIRVINTSGVTLNLTVSGNNIHDNNSTDGGNGIRLRTSTGTMTANITGNTITHHHNDQIHALTDPTNGGTLNLTISDNIITNDRGTNFGGNSTGRGIVVEAGANGTVTYNIDGNTITGSEFEALLVGGFPATGGGGASATTGTSSGNITNNLIGNSAIPSSGSALASHAVVVRAQGNGATFTTLIAGNTIKQYSSSGLVLTSEGGSPSLRATVTGNTITDPVVASAGVGLLLTFGVTSTGPDGGTMSLDVQGNAVAGSGGATAVSDIRARQRFATTVQLRGYTGGSTDTAAVQAFLIAQNSVGGTPTATATVQTTAPTGGGFTNTAGGAAVPLPAATTTADATAVAQAAMVGTAFTDLSVTVRNADGSLVADGTIVTFTRPGSGASGTFTQTAGFSATIAGNTAQVQTVGGIAKVQFAANGTAGTYTVSASAPGTASATFLMRNTIGAPLQASGSPEAGNPGSDSANQADDGILSHAELDSLIAAAIARWEASGLTSEQLSLLHNVTFTIEDLPGWYLGSSGPGVVTLDSNAAGNSWFIDSTPFEDSEFAGAGTKLAATANGGAAGRVDALTTVMHELGHQLGLDDSYLSTDSANLMYGWVQQSERRLPAAGQAGGVDPHEHEHNGPDFLFGSMNLGTLPEGKSLTIVYDATVNNITNGVAPTVTSQVRVLGDGGINVLSDDPSIGGAANPTETAIDGMILSNQVWNDADGDGVFNGADTGINGVTVNLYVDVNTNGVLDVGDGSAIASTTTAAGGRYSFNVLPGEYLVEIAASNFQGGGVLLGKKSTGGVAVDPDNNVDNDDNGVNNASAFANGISSLAITMDYNTEPGADLTGQFDNNNTLDFGFSDPPDVSVTKTDGVTTAVPGQSVTYTITVSNSGPSTATGTSFTDNFPAAITSASWTSVAAGGASGNTGVGSGNISETLDLPAGASVTYIVTATISASATGSLVNTANVSHPEDLTPANNTATDTDTLDVQTDISVTKTDGVTEAIPGITSLAYTITVSNTGPSDATLASLTDTFPASLFNVNWTSAAAGGASGNAVIGSGDINESLLFLPVGSSVTYTVIVEISPDATGNLVNTATVSHPDDTNPGNDSASDTDTLTPETDVSVTKTDGVTNVTPGTSTTYTITVSNSGPSTAFATSLVDTFPAEITAAGWSSVAAGGATGNTAIGAGNINETLTLPPGSSVTYTVNADIAPLATGNLVNTATVSQANDVNPGNDTATDSDTLGNPVSIAKITDGAEPATSGLFRVSQLLATGTDTVISYSVSGTAANGIDYTALSGTVTITAGNTSADIPVDILDDLMVEGTEAVVITLIGITASDPTVILSPNAANLTASADIFDDDTAFYTISDATVTEGGNLSFTVSLSNPVSVDTTVNVTFTDGTTSAGDFNHTTVPVTFPAGNNTAQVILVSTSGDNEVEGDETFTTSLVLAGPLPSGAASNVTDTGTGTITNDDTTTLMIDNPSIAEGDAGITLLTFTVTSPNGVEGGFTVDFSVTDVSTNNLDYTLSTSSPLVFAGTPGETQTITIAVAGDTIVESDESFEITLGTVIPALPVDADDIITGASGTGTITNDDSNTLTIDNQSVTEGDAGTVAVTFTVTSPNAVQGGFTLAFNVTNVTTNGADYTQITSSPLTFNGTAGETLTITFNVNSDTIIEGDESFTVTLGAVTPVAPVDPADIVTGAVGTGAILNDDSMTLQISSPVLLEGDSGNSLMFITVTAPNAVQGGFTVAFSLADITAGGADYSLVSSSPLTFVGTAGETQSIILNIVGDTIVEGDETVSATLGVVTPVTPVQASDITTGAVGIATIANDDQTILTVSNPSVTEGDSGTTTLTFVVTSPLAVQGGFTVGFNVNGLTADGSDYTVVTSSPLTFTGTAGEQQTISVDVVGDVVVEGDETLSVTLTGVVATPPVSASSIITGASGVGTIVNDDTSTLTISSPTVIEGDAGITLMTFTVTSSHAVQGGFTVDFSVADGTADGVDYVLSSSNPLVFAGTAGETQTITISVTGDTIVEGDESLTVTLGAVTPATPVDPASIITGAVGTGTITNDDSSVLTISSPTVTEGDSGTTTLSFTVTSPNAVQGGFTVDFSALNLTTDGLDYLIVTSSPLTFAGTAGETQTITVNVTGDTIVEADETFSVTLGAITPVTPVNPASIVTGATGIGTIVNDDVTTLSIDSPTVTEGNTGTTTLTFTVTSTNAVQGGFTVAFNVTDNTTDGLDYTVVTSSPVTFTGAAGETQTIVINVVGDTIVEGDETLTVTLGAVLPAGAVDPADIITGATGSGTILNDDTTTLTISSPSVTEGNAGTTTLTFTVTSPNAVQGGFTVDFSAGDITADGVDYSVVTGSPLTFAGTAGETQTITVNVVGDTIVEGDETLSVTLGTVVPAVPVAAADIITGAVGTGTILNDDTSTLTISSPTLTEGDGGTTAMSFTVTSPNAVQGGFSVAFSVANLTALAGMDYVVGTSSPLVFAGTAGETQTITVEIVGDLLVEADETFSVTLGAVTPFPPVAAASIISGAVGTGTIDDNDTATISIASTVDGAETDTPTNGRFTVTQSLVSSTDTVVTYTIAGTATPGAGNDYSTLTGTVTIPAGQTSVDVDVTVLTDNLIEDTETVIVTLTGFNAHDPDITLSATPANLTATVSITDDDAPTFTSAATADFAENTPASTVAIDVNVDTALIAPGHAVTYSLSGPDALLFSINSTTGEITFLASPDYEVPADQGADNIYNITVTATVDTVPSKFTAQDLAINVTPVNDFTPVFVDASPSFTIDENSPAATVVGGVSATDGDLPAETLTYSIVGGNASGAFTINPTTGQITVADATPLDFETTPTLTLTVRVTDNGSPTPRTADATVEIDLTDLQEGPRITIPNPLGTYHLGKEPAFISPDSTFTYGDIATPNYAGAQLTVSITSGRHKKDVLSIFPKGSGMGRIDIQGKKVLFSNVEIGTFTGGKGKQPNLVVTFNGSATTAAIDNLMRRLNFQAKKDVGVDRVITMQVTNIGGVDSNTTTRQISVVQDI